VRTDNYFVYTVEIIILMVVIALILYSSKIVAELLNNLRENKLKIYKSVFVSSVVSSELFKQKGVFTILNECS
jgi:ABC-type uncharacterized transport system permease subunit